MLTGQVNEAMILVSSAAVGIQSKKIVGKMPRELQIGVLLLMPFCLFANE
jgi:hypothetical protein